MDVQNQPHGSRPVIEFLAVNKLIGLDKVRLTAAAIRFCSLCSVHDVWLCTRTKSNAVTFTAIEIIHVFARVVMFSFPIDL
jgi:hypothetical protein